MSFFDSSTLGYVGLGLQAIGGLKSAFAAKKSSEANSAALDYQAAVERNKATVMGWQADDAVARGQSTRFSHGLKVGQLIGTQRATMAARGVALDEGSPLHILQDTDYMKRVDAATIDQNAAQEAWALRESAKTGMSNADFLARRAAAEDPDSAFTTSLLGTAGQVASSWYTMTTRRGA